MKLLRQIPILLILLSSCTNRTANKSAIATTDTINLILPDSLFAFENLTNSAVTRRFDWSGFTDTSKSKSFIRIDSLTVVKLLCPTNYYKPGEYSYYMTSFFYVAKQPKIGDIQPIIIWGNGDDYSDLILLTLDIKGNPIDYYSLHKQDCSGTETVEDSLMGFCPVKNSTINSNKIKTYINNMAIRPDTIVHFARIDSITFEATIQRTGKIELKKIDSVRYYRGYHW